jgi:hypothetical protein
MTAGKPGQSGNADLQQLEHHVLWRTGGRIRNLAIELQPERVILRGKVTSYYIKQLAQHGIRDLFPNLNLENSIVVEKKAELCDTTF